jgi:hypothetical protein
LHRGEPTIWIAQDAVHVREVHHDAAVDGAETRPAVSGTANRDAPLRVRPSQRHLLRDPALTACTTCARRSMRKMAHCDHRSASPRHPPLGHLSPTQPGCVSKLRATPCRSGATLSSDSRAGIGVTIGRCR